MGRRSGEESTISAGAWLGGAVTVLATHLVVDLVESGYDEVALEWRLEQ